MRITQGYVSKSVMDFPFHQVYALDDYNDWMEPCIFFGNYRYEDFRIITQNVGHKLIFWTGQDALDFQYWYFLHQESGYISNVTAHPKVHELITSKNVPCELVKPAAFLNTVKPQKLDKMIYAYCPSSAPDYHGWPIIKQLNEAGYITAIGTGRFTQEEWRNKHADTYYNECFIGLCLSEFAGGGGSIIEMGLRGMKVVTNVFDLPNCIPWNSVEDIMQAIEEETKLIGTTNENLANEVWNDLDHEHKWLEI